MYHIGAIGFNVELRRRRIWKRISQVHDDGHLSIHGNECGQDHGDWIACKQLFSQGGAFVSPYTLREKR